MKDPKRKRQSSVEDPKQKRQSKWEIYLAINSRHFLLHVQMLNVLIKSKVCTKICLSIFVNICKLIAIFLYLEAQESYHRELKSHVQTVQNFEKFRIDTEKTLNDHRENR